MFTIQKQVQLADAIQDSADLLADALDNFDRCWSALSDSAAFSSVSDEQAVLNWEYMLRETEKHEINAIAYSKHLSKLVGRLTFW